MAIYMWRERVPDTESIVIKIKADASGNLKIPVAGYTTSAYQNAQYNWKISVDSGAEITKSGTGSTNPITIATGLSANSEHMVTIKPTTEGYGWARAFGFIGSGISNLLTEVIYDGSYMGYATSSTNTGYYFRYGEYLDCVNLITAPEEVLPDTVTTIGREFRCSQYYNCRALLAAPEEVLPNSVTSIGYGFRSSQYYGNNSLTEIKGWKDLNIGNSSYRNNQFGSCISNKTVKVISDVGYSSDSNGTLANSYVTSVSVPSAYLNNFKNTSNLPRVNIDDSKFIGY